jgi:anti-sigma B factor antagonist
MHRMPETTGAPGVSVITAPKNLDVRNAPQLRKDAATEVGRGHHRLVVDMTGTVFMDVTGLGALVGVLRRVRACDGALALACDHELVLRVFEISGVAGIFTICPTVEAAVAAMGERADVG